MRGNSKLMSKKQINTVFSFGNQEKALNLIFVYILWTIIGLFLKQFSNPIKYSLNKMFGQLLRDSFGIINTFFKTISLNQ